MKKVAASLICALALAGPLAATAQTADPAALQNLREQLRTDKKAVVAKNLPLTEAEARKFWPLYEEYERKMQPLRQQNTLATMDFLAADAKLSDANARRLVNQVGDAESETLKLRKRYFDKMARAISARKAARFMQIESKIDALHRFDQAAAIPLAN